MAPHISHILARVGIVDVQVMGVQRGVAHIDNGLVQIFPVDAIRGYCGRERLADFYLLAALLGRDAAQIQGDEQFRDFLGIDLWVEFAIAISLPSDLISVEGGTEP